MNIKDLQERINREIAQNGLTMEKKLQSAHYGLFSSSDAVYDTREVTSYEQCCKLNDEGFCLDGSTDIGILLLNAIMKDEIES